MEIFFILDTSDIVPDKGSDISKDNRNPFSNV